ncbi:MAG: helix-turn-helix transcriptional regulator [Clostridia bacterium]|nr:helix-turn-helix transcriptional regulator [Clostridia bacterium]
MDQIKIGKFIAERRKSQGLTQMQLAEQLNITDRAVSKWETGRAMPDSALMLDLCRILQITVNDLLCGEVVTVENYKKELEARLMEVIREKEAADRRLLRLEIFIGIVVTAVFLGLCAVAAYVEMPDWQRALLIIGGLIPFLTGMFYSLKIEQTAGYYECARCRHRYVPAFSSVIWAMHMGRTRHMRCPQCHEKSWHKKVISKDKE